LLARTVAGADVVITTALVPGKRAPILVSAEMVQAMRPGSVLVDLAAEQGGNCALTEPGQDVVRHGVSILGPINLAGTMATHASLMYSRAVARFVQALAPEGKVQLNLEDELIRGPLVTHGGEVVHAGVKAAMGG
jgi:NAD(P) transhydrogenase subunit alpha